MGTTDRFPQLISSGEFAAKVLSNCWITAIIKFKTVIFVPDLICCLTAFQLLDNCYTGNCFSFLAATLYVHSHKSLQYCLFEPVKKEK